MTKKVRPNRFMVFPESALFDVMNTLHRLTALLTLCFFVLPGAAQWTAPANTGLGSVGNNAKWTSSDTHLYLDGTFRTADLGETWEQINYALAGNKPSAMIWNDGRLISGHNASGTNIFYSDDGGQSWTPVSSGPAVGNISAFLSYNGNLFAATTGAVYKSTDNGVNWSPHSGTGMGNITSLAEANGVLYGATTSNSNVWVSADEGETWNQLNQGISGFSLYGDMVFAMGARAYFLSQTNERFVSTDAGSTWTEVDFPGSTGYQKGAFYSRTSKRGYVQSDFTSEYIAVTYDGGLSFTDITGDLPNAGTVGQIGDYLIEWGGYLWALSGGVPYRMDVSSLATNVEDETLPARLVLDQNYPNPFNPSTRISFVVAGETSGHVRLSVHDLSGREVAVLVDGIRTSGRHEVTFDARNLPSGAYTYLLEQGGERLVRTMMLLK